MRRRPGTVLAAALLLSGLAATHGLAVSMETDRRSAIDRPNTGARYGATGIVRCGGAIGTAQLTLRADVITTAAHVLIDAGGGPRTCTFHSTAGGAPVAIDTQSIKAGSLAPMSEPATKDWAVARLARPVSGATPYGLAPPGTKPAGVFMVAAGNKRADRMGAESCKARGTLSASWEGVREFHRLQRGAGKLRRGVDRGPQYGRDLCRVPQQRPVARAGVLRYAL